MLEMLVLAFLVVCGLTVLDAVAARVGVEFPAARARRLDIARAHPLGLTAPLRTSAALRPSEPAIRASAARRR